MKSLKQAVMEYINYRCSLGFILKNDKLILENFVSYMKRKRATFVTNDHAIAFAKLNPHASRVSWAVRLAAIKRFAEYWFHMDPRTQIPIQNLGPSTYQRRAPYIYSDDEIERILDCCMKFSSDYEIERYSYYFWYGLLAITGMRIGEVARLDRNDLNLADRSIAIRNSKFRKSRLIPVHQSTIHALVHYLFQRDHNIPKPKTSRLFIDHKGAALSIYRARKVFRLLLIEAGIMRTSDGRPRIVDLRHAFAVNTLIRWYRRRVNIDQLIPLLSTYLGHSHLRYTYWYITVTPKLLKLITFRYHNKQRSKS